MIRPALRRFAIFVVASSLLTWWIAGEITGRGTAGGYQLEARFDDVAGLYTGDDVRLAGIQVGEVTGIDVVDGQAVVHLVVEDDVEVPVDSAVAVRWRNLIGQRYLSITPGTGEAMLADGDVVARADDVVDLGRIVNQLSPLAQSVGPEQVNRVLTALVTAFEGNEGAFDDLVTDFGSLSSALGDREALLGQLLADSATITEAIAARDTQIAAMVSNLSAITETLDTTDRLVDAALGEFSQFAQGTQEILTRSGDDLGAVLEHLAVLTGAAVDDLGLIETAVQTLPAMMDALLPTLNRGPYLRVNLLCVAAGPGACPIPLLFFEDESG